MKREPSVKAHRAYEGADMHERISPKRTAEEVNVPTAPA